MPTPTKNREFDFKLPEADKQRRKIILSLVMRTLFFILLLSAFCFAAPGDDAMKEALVGSWELVEVSKESVEIERLAERKDILGTAKFNADDTFAAEIWNAPNSPAKALKAHGKYSVKNGILTIFNEDNKTVTKSKVNIKTGILMIKEPSKKGDGYTLYFRRARS